MIERPLKAVRVKNLLKVEGVGEKNHNKYYDCYDLGTGEFIVYFGRVGASEQVKRYPISMWDKKIAEKLGSRKGYKDITHLRLETHVESRFADISDSLVAKLISDLQRYANSLIENTYLVGAGSVTMAQVEEAQRTINQLLQYVNTDAGFLTFDEMSYIQEVNKIFQHLYTVIPRKMKNVSDHLITKKDIAILEQMIANEQDNLDTMEGQVKNVQLQKEQIDDKQTLLDAMGLQIFPVDQKTISYIKSKMDHDSEKFKTAFRIINKKTQKPFDLVVDSAKNKKCEDFWHGSRNQNWWSILGTGLLLRPTNAVINGKMFGYGIYFADKFKKSLGYTSLSGSYWARGGDSKAYLALFDVHIGNQYIVERHRSEFSQFNWDKLRKQGDFDSIFAKGGYDLYNNEFIIYKSDQCSVKYLVEIGQ